MKRILSISLAILMLASCLSLTFVTHYCGGHAMDSAIGMGHIDLNCGMGSMDDHSDDSDHDNSFRSVACCDDKYVSVEMDDQFNSSIQEVVVDSKFIAAFAYAYLASYFFEVDQSVNFSDSSPPILKQDLRVLYQSFLI